MASTVRPSTSRRSVARLATRHSLPGAIPLVPLENPLPCRVAMVLSALAKGLDASAAERVFGYRQATITTWLTRAGQHAQILHERSFLQWLLRTSVREKDPLSFTARIFLVVKGILAIEIAGKLFSWTRENRP